jgi:hypothetical protein
MLEDQWQYNFYVNANIHDSLCCLPCPTSTILSSLKIFKESFTIIKDVQDDISICETSLILPSFHELHQ